jgi:hypothetical protein
MSRLPWLLSLLSAAWLAGTGCSTFGADPPFDEPDGDMPFEVIFGTSGTDEATGVIQLSDGDLLVVGNGNGIVAPADGTLPTPNLTKVTSSGNIVWSEVYDTLRYAHADAVVPLADGYAMFVSRSDGREAYGGGIEEVLIGVWFVDRDGQLGRRLFQRTSASVWDQTRPMARTSDGNLVLFGQDVAEDGSRGSWFITKINSDGGRIWETVVTFPVEFVEIQEGMDGTIYLTGAVGRPGGERPFLLSLSSGGDITRTLTLPQESGSAAAMAIGSGGRFGFVGRGLGGEPPTTRHNVFFVTSQDGSLEFAGPIGTPSTRWLSVATATDGSWLLAGTADSDTEGGADEVAFARIDLDGQVTSFDLFSYHPRIGIGYDVLSLWDGRVVIAGTLCPNQPTFGGPDCEAIVRTVNS